MELEEMIAFSAQRRSAGDSIEQVLAMLRERGATIADSLKVVRSVEGIQLGQAKEVVDTSKTWADLREPTQDIRSAALEALESEDYSTLLPRPQRPQGNPAKNAPKMDDE